MRIKYRLLIWYLLFLSVTLVSIWGFHYYARIAEVDDFARREAESLEHIERLFSDRIDGYKAGVVILQNYESVRGYFRANDSLDGVDSDTGRNVGEWRELVESAFRSSIRSQPGYYKVRLLSSEGKELVKVERRGDDGYVVEELRLQNESNRYYVKEMLRIDENDTYYSNVDLEVENGEIEVPLRPTLRVGRVIKSDDGRVLGLLVVNIEAADLFSVIDRNTLTTRRVSSYEGELLYYPENPELEYGIQLESGYVDERYLGNKEMILDSKNGDIEIQNRGVRDTPNKLMSYRVFTIGGGDYQRQFNLISEASIDDVLGNLNRNFVMVSGLVVGVLSLMFLIVYFLFARRMMSDINRLKSALSSAAQGKYEVKVESVMAGEMGELVEKMNKLLMEFANHEDEGGKYEKEVKKLQKKLEDQQIALLNVLEDVTEEKDIEHTRSQSLLETIGEGIVVTDEKGNISYVNPAFEEMFGYSNEELRGKDIAESLTAYDLNEKKVDKSSLSSSAALSSANEEMKLVIEGKDDKRMAVVINAAPIKLRDEFKGVIRVFHDFSEDLKLQRQKDDFFSIASHELRTPLTVISGNLDMLMTMGLAENVEKDGKELIEDSMEAADRLIDMVSDFLNVSRIEQGRLKMEIEDVEVCKVIDEVVDELGSLAEDKGIELRYYCPDRIRKIRVRGDYEKIRETLINFVGNSLKFTKKGYIKISPMLDDKFVTVVIEDTGAGIDESMQDGLFQRFQQAMDRTLAREAGGTGLGLYISRQFMRKMGGEAWLVESEKGKGATFAFRIPIVGSGLEKEKSKNGS